MTVSQKPTAWRPECPSEPMGVPQIMRYSMDEAK